MKRIVFSAIIALFILSGCAKKDKRPNIIFLLTDDQTSVATGCYGNDQVETPNMDKLAQEGVMFANHYNTTSICMASRAIIMTGMYEYKTGCNFKHGPLHHDKFQKSYPVLLREAGYYTGFAGKFGFSVSDGSDWDEKDDTDEHVNAFNQWAGSPDQSKYETAQIKNMKQYADKYPHSTRAYGAWAGDFIKKAKKSNKPFCMSISFKAPHLPFTPDPFFDSVYEGKTYRKPDNYGAENAKHLSPQAKSGRQYNDYDFWRASEASYQEAIKKYNQLIYGVDYAIGMIRKSLKEQGVDDNTIIIFTGDNGYSCGAHNLSGKVLPYEEASRSPLIIFDPRLPEKNRGVKRETITANIDMAPTILSYAGVDIPQNVDGANLIPLINQPNGIKRNVITLTNMWGNDEIQAMSVVTKNWKYIFWQYSNEQMETSEELYDVSNDRLEMHNCAKDPEWHEKLLQMRKLYDKQFQILKNNIIDYNDYEKYKIFFDRSAKAEAKKPFLTGDYKEVLKQQAIRRAEKQRKSLNNDKK